MSLAPTTIVFADLAGSTAVFEAIGNEKAADTVTRVVQWVAKVCEAHGGRVVKTLGDGVFAIFGSELSAITAVVEVQRGHQKRIAAWPTPLRMELQIGLANGEVVEVDGDIYGDAVNVASRLSGLAGAGQIWATEGVAAQLLDCGIAHRSVGSIHIRGRTDQIVAHRIDWQEDAPDSLTVPSRLVLAPRAHGLDFGQIALSWLNTSATFRARDLPINLGRESEANFVVNDPRVSRLHARIEARSGGCVLVDVSTYGTWVRFKGNGSNSVEMALRRDECVLHGSGEIGLGAPLSDFSAPTISFETSGAEVEVVRRG